jgi:hypothetical protein
LRVGIVDEWVQWVLHYPRRPNFERLRQAEAEVCVDVFPPQDLARLTLKCMDGMHRVPGHTKVVAPRTT